MDIHGLIEAMSSAGRMARTKYHVTLGGMIAVLKECPPDNMVVLSDTNDHPGEANSYRGYYEDLAFAPQDEPVTVADFLSVCKSALGYTFEGYKGGDFTMKEDTPLWIASYGSCSDRAVVGVKKEDGKLTLLIKDVEAA